MHARTHTRTPPPSVSLSLYHTHKHTRNETLKLTQGRKWSTSGGSWLTLMMALPSDIPAASARRILAPTLPPPQLSLSVRTMKRMPIPDPHCLFSTGSVDDDGTTRLLTDRSRGDFGPPPPPDLAFDSWASVSVRILRSFWASCKSLLDLKSGIKGSVSRVWCTSPASRPSLLGRLSLSPCHTL